MKLYKNIDSKKNIYEHRCQTVIAKACNGTDKIDQEKNIILNRRVPMFPLAAIVGQDDVKEALLLGAIDNRIGGIAIAGRRGTAKSAIARGLHALLPPIECVVGSWYNADPEDNCGWDNKSEEKIKNSLIR